MAIERKDDEQPELIDYETACLIMADIEGRAPYSTPKVLAQYVKAIRRYGAMTPKFD